MRPHSSRAKVSPHGVLLRGTRESTCKSSLIDRISRRTTHTLYYYHFLASDNTEKPIGVAPRTFVYFRLRRPSRKESLLTPLINAFHYYRRTRRDFCAHPLLLRRASPFVFRLALPVALTAQRADFSFAGVDNRRVD